MSRLRRQIIAIALIASMTIIYGCGRVSPETIKSELESQLVYGQSEAVVQAATAEPEEEIINFEIGIPGKKGKVLVNATVHADMQADYSVYESEVMKRNDANLKELADSLFTNSEYEVLLSPDSCTETSVKKYIDRFEDEMEALAAENGMNTRLYAQNVRNGATYLYNNYKLADRNNNFVSEEQQIEDGKLYYDTYENTRRAMLLGEIDGEKWLLYDQYDENVKDYLVGYTTSLMKYAFNDVTTFFYEENESGYNVIEDTTELRAAQDFLNRLGIKGYEAVYTCNVRTTSSFKNNDNLAREYGFTAIVGSSHQVFMDNSEAVLANTRLYTDQKVISVVVRGDEILFVSMSNTKNAGKVIEQSPKIISLDEANDCFTAFVLENYSDLDYNMYLYDITLGYVTVNDEEKGERLIPAWVYFENDSYNNELRNAFVAISAIDGQVIYFPNWVVNM